MSKQIPLLFFFSFCLFFTADAQTDSAYYDLGHILMKKNFTQTLTIKGSDLERYQFSNISDALNVWLYGTYSNASTLTYVIDGNMVTDVNAYSIHDIEEITLVQNAMVQLNGASGPQQLVLIKTKRNRPGKQGIEAAGQTSLVTLRTTGDQTGEKAQTNWYHDYYLSAYKNYSKSRFGISADYMQDVSPGVTDKLDRIKDPLHFDRFKLNGYAGTEVWKGSTLSFDVSYIPQQDKENVSQDEINDGQLTLTQTKKNYFAEHLLNAGLNLKSHIIDGLNNTFSAAYSHYHYKETSYFDLTIYTDPPTLDNIGFFGYNTISNLELRDNLYYEKKIGDFVFEPALNFSFRYLRDSLSTNSAFSDTGDPTSPVGTDNLYTNFYKAKIYLLTPSLSIYYKNAISLQGGFLYNLTPMHVPDGYTKPQKVLPFVSATADVMHLLDRNVGLSIKLYGSYALSYPLGDGYASLSGFISPLTPSQDGSVPAYGSFSNGMSPADTSSAFHSFKTITAGVEISPAKTGLTIGYLFEKRNYVTSVVESISDGETTQDVTINTDVEYYLNSIHVNYNLLNGRSFKWQTGINATEIKETFQDVSATVTGAGAWTGGFVNQFEYKNLFAGANLLYMLKEQNNALNNKTNSFALQNLYLGLHVKTAKLNNLELFANGRNIIQNKASDITDNRKFYGLGFKLGL